MTEVITDTGPILHLNEINKLFVLDLFKQFNLPDLVADELKAYGLNTNQLRFSSLRTNPLYYLIFISLLNFHSIVGRGFTHCPHTLRCPSFFVKVLKKA